MHPGRALLGAKLESELGVSSSCGAAPAAQGGKAVVPRGCDGVHITARLATSPCGMGRRRALEECE
eukprot:3000860-Alexandrium_andersonii.AAC.1